MATTVRTLLTQAMRTSTVLSAYQDPTVEDMADVLAIAQQMLSLWNTQDLLLPAVTRESFTIPLQQELTIGSGIANDLNTVCPVRIERADLIDSADSVFSLKIANIDRFSQCQSSLNVTLPKMLYFNPPGDSGGVGTLYFDVVPDEAYTLSLVSLKPIISFTSLDDVIDFPAGYEATIRLNVAVLWAMENNLPPNPMTVAQADGALSALKASNMSNRTREAKNDYPQQFGRGFYGFGVWR